MPVIRRHFRTRLGRPVATLAAALVVGFGLAWTSPETAEAVGPCANAGSQFEPGSLPRMRWKVRCLLNRERARRGLARLHYSRLLRLSANAHGLDMVRHRYFSHRGAGGRTLGARVARAGYRAGARRWIVGENLGWLTERQSLERTMVRLWMASPPHRHVILNPRYRDFGLSVIAGAPDPSRARAMTFVLQLGRRW
jgi:uncharacterized protein YkwD